MPKNDVQLLQEIVDKLGGSIANNLASLSSISESASETASQLAATSAALNTANETLSKQLDRLNPSRAGFATSITGVAATNANPDTWLLQYNPLRKGGTIYNDSAAILYLLLGVGTATSSNFTVQVPPNGYYELPFSYAGPVRGVWSSATGSARVTEYTL